MTILVTAGGARVLERRGRPLDVRLCLLALLLCLLTVPGWAKDKPAPSTPAAAAADTAKEPHAYAVTEVIPRSERALGKLHGVRRELDADQSARVVEAELPRLNALLEDWAKTEAPTLREGRSVQQVNDLAAELTARSVQLERWGVLLLSSGKTWIAEAQALEREWATWQATRAALPADAPSVIRERIDVVLREIEAVQQLYREKTNGLIATQSTLAAKREALGQIRADLAAVRAGHARGLLAPDSRPLWTALSDPARQSLVEQARAGWTKLQRDGLRLIEAVRTHLPVHASLFVGLLALFLALKRMARSAGHVQPNAAEQLVLDRSFFSALLLAVGLVPVLYPELSPRSVRLVILPGMVTVLVLRRALFTAGLRGGLLFFAVVYLLDFLRAYLPPQWQLARLLLFSVSALGAVGIAIVLKRLRVPALNQRSVRHPLTVLGVVAFLGSVIANLAGNLSLAEYLVSPAIRLIFLAIAIRLGVVVSTTLAVMALSTPVALLSRVIQERGQSVAANVRKIIGVAGLVLWGYLALFNLGLLTSLQDSVVAIMKVEWQLGAAVISVRDFVIFVLVMFAAYLVSRVLRLILAEEIFPRISFPRGVPDAMVLIARYGVLLFGFLLALSSAGVDLSNVTLALSALGVGIGFGLQNVVNNFVCGLILVFEHPIQVGDYIEVGSYYGKVTRIGFRSSIVLTRDGSEVVIPNAELIGSKVINWSLSDAVSRVSVLVPVAHGEDTARVIEVLKSVAAAHPQVRDHPPPRAVLTEFGDSALKFLLHCWVRTENRFAVRDELGLAVDQAFREAGIRIPFAQSDVHLHFPEGQPPSSRSEP